MIASVHEWESSEARGTVVFREGQGLRDWWVGGAVGGMGGKEPPQKKSCWEEQQDFHLTGPSMPTARPLPGSSHITRMVPLCLQQGISQGPSTITWLAALSPGPAGLTQWILSPKLKLLQNKNPSL